jgi:hypothetical protein
LRVGGRSSGFVREWVGAEEGFSGKAVAWRSGCGKFYQLPAQPVGRPNGTTLHGRQKDGAKNSCGERQLNATLILR